MEKTLLIKLEGAEEAQVTWDAETLYKMLAIVFKRFSKAISKKLGLDISTGESE